MNVAFKLTKSQANNVIFTYGIIAGIVYMLYFLVMKVTGFANVTELRFLNYFLFGLVGFLALQKATKEKGDGKINYFQGMGIAFFTGALSFIFLGIFILIYSFVNPNFIETVTEHTQIGITLSPFNACLLVSSEGIAMSAILSLCLMQYFKRFSEKSPKFLSSEKIEPRIAPENKII